MSSIVVHGPEYNTLYYVGLCERYILLPVVSRVFSVAFKSLNIFTETKKNEVIVMMNLNYAYTHTHTHRKTIENTHLSACLCVKLSCTLKSMAKFCGSQNL